MDFSCPQCQVKYQIKPEWLGKKVACPSCEKVIQLPAIATGATTSADRSRPFAKPSVPPTAKPAATPSKSVSSPSHSGGKSQPELSPSEEFPLLPEETLVPMTPIEAPQGGSEKPPVAVSRFRGTVLPGILGLVAMIGCGLGLHYVLTEVLGDKLFAPQLLASIQPDSPPPVQPVPVVQNQEGVGPGPVVVPVIVETPVTPEPTEPTRQLTERELRNRPKAPNPVTPVSSGTPEQKKQATLKYWNDLRRISIPAPPVAEVSIQDYQRYLKERSVSLAGYVTSLNQLSTANVDEDLLLVVRSQLALVTEMRAICDRVGNLELFADLVVEYDAVKRDLAERELALKVNFQNRLNGMSGPLGKRHGTIFPTGTSYR